MPKSKVQSDYVRTVKPEGIDITPDDRVDLARGSIFPITVNGGGVPGSKTTAWRSLSSSFFYGNMPVNYSILLRRESSRAVQGKVTAGRTILEGFLSAVDQKFGRSPSTAERIKTAGMEAAETSLAFDSPIYKTFLMAALYSPKTETSQKRAELNRREIEGRLNQRGLQTGRFYYEAWRALNHLQPGGEAFPIEEPPLLFLDEALPLIPKFSCPKPPPDDAVWLGRHVRDGSDVFFSSKVGFTSQPLTSAITTLLGQMGQGKTYLMRSILVQRLLMGRTVVSLDPEGENNDLCKALGGTVLPTGIPDDPDTCLMHPIQGVNPTQMLNNLIFVLGVIQGEGAVLPGIENLLGMAIMKLWDEHQGAPIMISELVEKVATLNSPDVETAVNMLQPYARDGINAGYFDRPKALLKPDFEKGSWINFDLSGLHGSGEGQWSKEKKIIYVMLTAFLRDAVVIGRNPMDIFIDEASKLLENKLFTGMLDDLGRRARKRDTSVILNTQLPRDFLSQNTSMNLATNSFIGHLPKKEAQDYLDALGLTEEEGIRAADMINEMGPYHFMCVPAGYTGRPFVFRAIIPDTWLALFEKYKMYEKG